MCHNPHADVEAADAHEVLRRRRVPCRLAQCRLPRGQGPPEGGRAVSYLPRAARGPGGCQRLYRVPHRGAQGRSPEQTAPAVRHPEGPATESLAGRTPPDTHVAGPQPGRTGALPGARRRTVSRRATRVARQPTAALADTFSHRTHRELACITCHSTSSRTSDLTFQPPRGCQICHHQRPTKTDCASCHQAEEIDAGSNGHGQGERSASSRRAIGRSTSSTRRMRTSPASSATSRR